ncbi:hypothetical protein [Bradyrhizobium sp. UFLA05-112]
MRHDYKIAMVLIFANMSVSAFAGDNLKGTYAVAGTSTCLAAPSGFANDSEGNPTIANGTDSAWKSATRCQVRVIAGKARIKHMIMLRVQEPTLRADDCTQNKGPDDARRGFSRISRLGYIRRTSDH